MSSPRWTPARVKTRVRAILAEYQEPVSGLTVCDRMPSCCCHVVRHSLDQLSIMGDVDITGVRYKRLYALSRVAEFSDIISKLWKREPVFTELRVCR